ncbi:MAG TPA: hypothetical protein VFE42_26705 [Chloroflexota bacterium]|nr:hypothetical protein [Chloroflexota bacterium]
MGVARGGASVTQIIAYVLLAAVLSSTGNLIIKNAVKTMGGLNLGANAVQSLFHLFTNPGIVVGLGLYLIGFVIWARVLSLADISTAYPIFISLAFTIVVVGSRLFFNESLGLLKIAGIVIIALGIVIVSRG